MKHLQFSPFLLFVAWSFILSSCNNGGEKKGSTADSAAKSAADSATAPVTVNTIVTKPHNMMVVTHKVSNFSKWRASYDAHDSMRLANAVHNHVIGRGFLDSNMVMVSVKFDDLEKAKAFSKDANLKKVMKEGGVTGAPGFSFVTIVWQDTAALVALRSRTNFEVKDWDTWQKNFLEGKQERLDNGIVDRAYGHDIADNKKVILMSAITDTAKAFAYYKSDALKKRREAGGVIGEPKRFIYRMIKRY